MNLSHGFYITTGNGSIHFNGSNRPNIGVMACNTNFIALAQLASADGLHYSYFDHESIALLNQFIDNGGSVIAIEQTQADQVFPIMADLIHSKFTDNMIGLTIDQDWDNERTIYRFIDNSAIIDCNGILTIEKGI